MRASKMKSYAFRVGIFSHNIHLLLCENFILKVTKEYVKKKLENFQFNIRMLSSIDMCQWYPLVIGAAGAAKIHFQELLKFLFNSFHLCSSLCRTYAKIVINLQQMNVKPAHKLFFFLSFSF
jgi:hypothetical protein